MARLPSRNHGKPKEPNHLLKEKYDEREHEGESCHLREPPGDRRFHCMAVESR